MTTLAFTASNEMVSGRERLRRYVSSALARLRAQEALRSTSIVLNISAWLLAICIFADRLFSLDKLGVNMWIIWSAMTALGIPYILWRTYSPRIHQNLAAVLCDDRLGLHARLSTALTLDLDDPANAPFGEAFFEEALSKLAALKVEQAFPVSFPRSAAFSILPMGIAALLFYFMPPQDVLGLVTGAQKKRQAELVRAQAAKQLEGKLEDMRSKKPEIPVDPNSGQFKVNQLLQKADSIAKEMRDGKRTADEALVALGQLKRDIQNEKEKVSQGKDFLDRLEKLSAKDLNTEEGALTKDVSEALKMGDPAAAARQMRKLAEKMKEDILENKDLSDEQKKQELDKLQREVEKLAGALAEDEALRDNLQNLAQTLNQADFEKIQQAMKDYKDPKNKGKKKNLGDDVSKEINDIADELERLDDENDEKLNEEEKDEMDQLNEVEEGVEEAMESLDNEGENGEQQQGQQQGQQGQQGQQAGGKSSKSGKAGKNGKNGKSGKSGKVRGRMAGQQAGQQPGQQQGQQSNQGGQQPGDQNNNPNKNGKPGRGGGGGGPGQGHRPYRDGDAQFESQKVKGQMQAGAITGLSHFRGQGAKGDAPQDFVSTMTAASQDAESSLELERIPSDARDVVKDYFRSVKEATIPNAATAPTTAPNK
jgi:hypothetical protein